MMLFMTLQQRYAMRPDAQFKCAWWLGAALAMAANVAFAADCDMRLSSAEVNYGALSRGEMNVGQAGTTIALGGHQLTLTAVCRQETTIGLHFDGEAVDVNSYRFAGKGRFTVRVSNATLDGNAVQLARTTNSAGGTMSASAAEELRPNERITAVTLGQRAVGKVFSAQIEIEAYVDDATTRVREVTLLEGRGALTLDTR